jgi:hypothetical protein
VTCNDYVCDRDILRFFALHFHILVDAFDKVGAHDTALSSCSLCWPIGSWGQDKYPSRVPGRASDRWLHSRSSVTSHIFSYRPCTRIFAFAVGLHSSYSQRVATVLDALRCFGLESQTVNQEPSLAQPPPRITFTLKAQQITQSPKRVSSYFHNE